MDDFLDRFLIALLRDMRIPHIFAPKYRVLEIKMEDGKARYYPQYRGRLFIYRNFRRPAGSIIECDTMEHAENSVLNKIEDDRREKQSRTIAEKNVYEFNEVFALLKKD